MKKVVIQLEEQRCLIEAQRVEMLRMKRHISLQKELIGLIHAELDALKSKVLNNDTLTPTQKPGDGQERVMARHAGTDAQAAS